jgi:hypothetical protein
MYRADWYPDPTNRFEYRYHNGLSWTGDVSVGGNRFLDPLPTSQQAGPPKPKSGQAVAAFVLALASVLLGWVPFICVLAVAAAVLAIIFAIGALRGQRRLAPAGGTRDGRGFAVAGLVLAPFGLAAAAVGLWLTVLVFRAVDEYANAGPFTFATTSCTVEDGQAVFRGTITNLSTKTRSYHLVADFVRSATDNRLATTSTDIDDVEPGATAEWNVITYVSTLISTDDVECRVRDVTGPVPFGLE